MSRVIEAHGFTNRVLGWDAWLDVVELADASPEQITVLEESHPKAKESDYLPVPCASAGDLAAALGRFQRDHVCTGRLAACGAGNWHRRSSRASMAACIARPSMHSVSSNWRNETT